MTPRYAHLLALVALVMLVASGPAFAQTDYDTDGDNLIDVTSLAQLNAIRYDLNGDGSVAAADTVAYNDAFPYAASGMGCQATCTGYELMNNLDFDENNDGSITSADATYWNSGNGWSPIGTDASASTRYQAAFKGNGHTINNLFISRSTINHVGLFGAIHSTSLIETLGVTNANVTGNENTGILIGTNRGTVVACYTTGAVTANGDLSGGLIGHLSGSISTSYSTASVSGTRYVGGLVGFLHTGYAITNSYSTGRVSGSNYVGGLTGDSIEAGGSNLTACYWDTTTSVQTTSDGGTGYATDDLQRPTGYTGIYSAWNVNIDSNSGNDDPWDFGTSSQYPVLKYSGHSLVAQGRPATDYDLDNDRLIDITTLAQLNAIRHDLNGNGDATHADYGTAFPLRNTSSTGRMGCPSGTCIGYELLNNLDFDENNDGAITQADTTYWNGGAGWAPIGSNTAPYTATFEGNGKTISHLYINRYVNFSGFFASTDTTAHIRSLGLVNAVINTGQGTVGALVGLNKGRIAASYVTGSVTANTNVGGLVGAAQRGSYIVASYAMASVVCNQSGPWGTGGGLVGANGSGATIASSYSLGSVTGACLHKHGLAENSGTVTDSYWDTQTSDIADDSDTVAPEGKLTADLQSVTSASGIYANWDDLTIDASGTNDDDPWTFGTTKQYPALTFAGLDTTAQYAAQPVNYDTDSDGLLEVSTLAQLHAMRWDLDGNGFIDASATTADTTAYNAAFPNGNLSASKGCPSTGCTGYELLNNLDFDENNDGAITQADATYWNSGAGWLPLGPYSGTFKGNNKTISHLFIDRGSRHDTGLFHAVDGDVSGLGLLNVNVTGADRVGGLAGNQGGGGTISSCYVTGRVSGSKWGVGGLVGRSYRTSGTNRIVSSYALVSVSIPATVTSDGMAGGLVGWLTDQTEVVASYALGSVFAGHSSAVGGGLVGSLASGSDVTASYATGAVTGAGTKGGLVGSSAGTVTDSYWDTQTSGIVDDSDTVAPEGKLTADLQSVTSASGIYANWDDLTIDASGTNDDDPWTFGTTKQYPVLTFAGLDTTAQYVAQPVNYDTDSDGLLEVSSLAQLHAMRWDINGDGAIDSSATTADTTAYNAAFPNGNLSASKGCPSSGCTGYELLNNLDFDENNDGAITSADAAYWNSGQGWMPIGSDANPALRYTGDFKGNGYTVQNLFISRSTVSYQALFGGTGTNSRIESLGVTDADVTADDFSAILVGGNRGEIVACYTTGRMTGGNVVGGLVGWTGGSISTSYSLASVSATERLGGLVGSKATTGSITNSYSTGAVSLSSGSMTSIGGLLGESNAGTGTVTYSYWDTSTSGQTSSAGGSGVVGKTASELQSPTTYGATSNDTYYNWNANIDGQAGNDDPWTFGTMDQYPALKYAGLDTTVQFQLQPAVVMLALMPSSISESGGMSTVTATLAHPLSAATTITVRPVADAYTVAADSTITIAAGSTANAPDTVVITAVDNTRDELNRDVTVTVVADNAQGSVVLPTEITITDDDPQPRLSISSPSAVEGTALTFTVRLNAASGKAVTVAYADAGTGTATSGTDYTALTAGTLTFAAGTTSQTIAVSVTDDSDDEQNETVIVTLSSATNATISTAQGTGTIIDDDGMPALSIGSPSVIEGATGATLTFRVYLRPAHTAQVTVAYADASTGTATSGTDYTALTAGTLTFAASDTIQTIPVSVTDDSDDEPNETVIVTLSSATNATISTAQGTGTIIDDETSGANLDVDGNGEVRLFSDIILVIRYVLFFREEALLRGNVIEPTATRTTPQDITPYLDTLVGQNILDVDGDGDVRLFSDIILIIRYVLFFRNEALVRGNVIEQNATRTTSQEIEPYIRSLYPDSHFQ